MTDAIAIAAFLAAAALLLAPRVRGSKRWRATVTPLASIIGSGFLVSLPLLTEIAGVGALVPMAALIVLAYWIGGAIRFNIAHGEKLFDAKKPLSLFVLERIAHLALAFAYFISVTYYLSLLAVFLFKGVGVTPPYAAKVFTTAALASIGAYGFFRGLHALEVVEEYAVALNLSVIAAVLAALFWFNGHLLWTGHWPNLPSPPAISWHSARVALGLLIVVQGFETSRFLKGVYPPVLRVATMRNAQLIAAAIYVVFYALAAVVAQRHFAKADVAAITTMLRSVALVLPIMLIGGAVFAQASASIADAIGSAGLLSEASEGWLTSARAYPVIAAVGIGLTWTVNIFGVIALASRAFALFYLLECVVAGWVAFVAPGVGARWPRALWFWLLALMAATVVIFGIPAGG